MIKFPKTPRLTKILQDENKDWKHLNTIVQEKLDGANAGISFENNTLHLQSRGHYLRGGPRERQFDLLKQWAWTNEKQLFSLLKNKYVLFGEWLYAKHHIFYDSLPHYFMAFDLLDKQEENFLNYRRFQEILQGSIIATIPVIYQNEFGKINNFTQFITKSRYKTKNWKTSLVKIAGEKELEYTDLTDLMEGIYIRVEDDNWVLHRIKHPRVEFSKVRDNDSNWLTRNIVTNKLAST